MSDAKLSIDEYRLTLTVKNNLILKNIEKLGFDNVNQFCLNYRLSPQSVGSLINMKETPLMSNLKWKPIVNKICEIFSCAPEDIFTDTQINQKLETNKKYIEMKEAEIISFMENQYQIEHKSTAESFFIENKRSDTLNKLMGVLTQRERRVIDLRMDEVTFSDIAKEMGVTGERIRKIEAKAMIKLKNNAASGFHDLYREID